MKNILLSIRPNQALYNDILHYRNYSRSDTDTKVGDDEEKNDV